MKYDIRRYWQAIQYWYLYQYNKVTAASSPLLNDLVAYWKLDETSGTRFDSTANSNDLTDVFVVGSTSGKIGNAAVFVSANSTRLSLADSTPLNPDTGNFTISVWFRTTSTTFNTILGVYTTFSAAGWALAVNNGGVYTFFNDSGNNGGFKPPSGEYGSGYNDGDWHLYIAEFNRITGIFAAYVDNILVGSTSIAAIGSVSPAAVFSIGARGTSNFWDGDIDEVGIWKRLLTPAERALLYNSGSGLTFPFV